jgi:hypothetical protein
VPMRTLITLGLLACVALPAAAFGHSASKTDKTNGARECRMERATTAASKEAFAQKYGTAKSHYKNAFGKCVSRRARDERAEREAAKAEAKRVCREQDAHPLGKCVSQKAKQEKQAADARDREQFKREHNAATACAEERSTIGRQAFAEKYGTVKAKRRNAFGKCVSQQAKS